MIKSGLKKYFVNLKYYFTPIGMLAVAMVIGLSIAIPGAIAAVKQFINSVIEILRTNNVDFTPTKDYIVGCITSLDWNDPINSLLTMLSRDWLANMINGSLELIGIELKTYADLITAAFDLAVGKIIALACMFVTLSVLGLILGFMLTRYLVRRNMAKRGFWKTLLAAFLDAMITILFFAFSAWLAALWTPSLILSALLAVIVFMFLSLFEAYLIHGRRVVPLGMVMRLGNVFKLLLTDVLIFVISLIFLAISIGLTNVVAGVFIGFSFVEIAYIVITLNAESYVKDLSDNISMSLPQSQAA